MATSAWTFTKGAYTGPHKTPCEDDTTKEKAHRFASCDQRLALPKVRDTLVGTTVFRSYVDPDTQ
jgi:hypothetical protein